MKRTHRAGLIGLGAALGYTAYALLPTVWGALRHHSQTIRRLDRWVAKAVGL